MAKGRFNIKGTKDFLVAAILLGMLCAWAVRDGWFPSKKTLKKHPQSIEVSFDVSGVIKEIPVKAGDELNEKVLLASLYTDSYETAVEDAQAAFNTAKDTKAADVEEKLDVLLAARENLKSCTVHNTDIIWTSSHGEEPLRGTVREILAEPATEVEAGQPILVVNPKDTFYLFNKTLAVLTFITAFAALIFHWIASR